MSLMDCKCFKSRLLFVLIHVNTFIVKYDKIILFKTLNDGCVECCNLL